MSHRHPRCQIVLLSLVQILGSVALLRAAPQTPKIEELRTQRVGSTTYFEVRLAQPRGSHVAESTQNQPLSTRLIPQDGKTDMVEESVTRDPELTFLGRFHGEFTGNGQASFVLLYQGTSRTRQRLNRIVPRTSLQTTSWHEVPVTVDFSIAKVVSIPANARTRRQNQMPNRDDLQGQWALARIQTLSELEQGGPDDFGFYAFAREMIARSYQVPSTATGPGGGQPRQPNQELARLYETTTGASAIAESLQTQRLQQQRAADQGVRNIDVTTLPGIDIAEHPWKELMAGKQPDSEPLAQLVPHDNYYIRFKSAAKFFEFRDLFDQWGTMLSRAVEIRSRDYGLGQRYQRQLCLNGGPLARLFAPTLVRSLAITGSDLYLREGTDITVILQVSDQTAFRAAVEPLLGKIRAEFGERLAEKKVDHHGVAIESFVTPLREVSLYRATHGEYVIHSNSLVGLKRVLDASAGRTKPLADALDFRYMRTVFRANDAQEDGFAFLSDAFIRQLVGPASKIKEKRRLETLASLYMASNAALYCGWEMGKLPADYAELLNSSGLRPTELYTAWGTGITWDGKRRQAISDACNTLDFATPLIELSIDRVTEQEQREYDQFRQSYMNLWRRYFDPIGVRASLTEQRVRVETYILPLIQSSSYNELRRLTGNGTTTLRPGQISPKTLFQVVSHIAPDLPERREMLSMLSALDGAIRPLDAFGDWLFVRLEDGPALAKLAEMAVKYNAAPESEFETNQATQLLFEVPLTVGVAVRNPLVFAGLLAALRGAIHKSLPGAVTWEPVAEPYKGITYVQVKVAVDQFLGDLRGGQQKTKPIQPVLSYALLKGGWYVTLSEASLKEQIDRVTSASKTDDESIEVNSSLYLAPSAASKPLRAALDAYLESETRQRAMTNVPIWYALYRGQVITPQAQEAARREAAARLLGFVPVSPDDAEYSYEARIDEVSNRRHGSLRRPMYKSGIDAESPLSQLLNSIRSLRADLRFREDGIHTTLTLDRMSRKER